MSEHEFAVDAGDVHLAGTLRLPPGEGPFPVVVMLHGSGPLDRDENFGAIRLDVFNTLARDLETIGVASYRYDKRGCGASTGDYRAAGHFDLVADAIAVFDAVRADPRARPDAVFLIGHSEGTLIAAEVSLARPEVAGLVLLAPFVTRLEPLLMMQAENGARDLAAMGGLKGVLIRLLARIVGSPVEKQRRLIEKVRADKECTGKGLPSLISVRWMREMLELDPAAVFRQVRRPMLILGGGKDLQCDPADVARIEGIAPAESVAEVIPDMTHLLRREPGRATFETYPRQFKAPLHPAIHDRVLGWLERRLTA